MNILYVGSGFVGACSAAVSAASGHTTLVYDIDQRKIELLSSGDRNKIESCLFEEGLADLLIRNQEKITFTLKYSDVEEFLDTCDAVFMCLPTPEIGETGESNLSYYFDAAEKLSMSLLGRNKSRQEKYVVIINKSTVPIDMVNRTQEIMESAGVKNFGVVSNPEFLVEGKAIEGSLKPSRVVVGAWKEDDFEVMRKIYRRFYDSSNIQYIEVNPKEAAAGKLLANFYLFAKLQLCFDVVGRTCETFDDLSFENLRHILTSDPRISNWGFYDSLYAGGSCFIKDSRSLSHQLQTEGKNATFVNEVYTANKRQLEFFISRAENEANVDWSKTRVALLGVAFKQDTNDIRNSPSIDIVNFLKEKQAPEVKIYDPVALYHFKTVFPESEQIKYFTDELKTIEDVDVVIISTDWQHFKGLEEELIKLSSRPLIMDGRRILQNSYINLQKNGFSIIPVGGPFIKGKK